MRLVGSDYIFKLMSPDFVESLFNVRKRYFLGGEPSEISKGKIAYFVAKFKKSDLYKQYTLVGEGRIKAGYQIAPGDKDYAFATQNSWQYVIEFENLKQYTRKQSTLASEVFSDQVMKKLNSQRPYGVALSSEESKIAKERIRKLSPEG